MPDPLIPPLTPHAPDTAALDLATVVRALGPTACRVDIDALPSCESTNSTLMAQAEAGAPSGRVVVADMQTAGRGRRGRHWIASPGDSLTFSLLWRFPPQSPAPAALSLAVGVALARAIEAVSGQAIQLKWPNDLLHDNRKLGGILTELQPGNLRSAVIGIGLNLRLPASLPAEIAEASTALDTLIDLPRRDVVLAACLRHLIEVLDAYAINGFAPLHGEWQAHHAWPGEAVRISGGSETIEGRCHGIDMDGNLLIETPAGLRSVSTGDVSLRRATAEPRP